MWQIEKNFETFIHSDLIISVCLDLVLMYIYVKYEGSMVNCSGRRDNYGEREKWLLFKTLSIIDIIFHVHLLGGIDACTCKI